MGENKWKTLEELGYGQGEYRPKSIVSGFTDKQLGIGKYTNRTGKGKGLSNTEKLRVEDLYLRGISIGRMALAVSVSIYYVRNYLKELKKTSEIPAKHRKKSNNLKKQEIMRARLYG